MKLLEKLFTLFMGVLSFAMLVFHYYRGNTNEIIVWSCLAIVWAIQSKDKN